MQNETGTQNPTKCQKLAADLFYINESHLILIILKVHLRWLRFLGKMPTKETLAATQTSKNIDCLMACTACLVCFISSVNGRSNKKRKEEAYPWKAGTSSRHISNLKQSILETFDIYGLKSSLFKKKPLFQPNVI